MTANRNTIWALGLMLCAWAAGKSTLEASSIDSNNSISNAGFGASGKTGSDTLGNSTSTSGCNAGCDASCATNGTNSGRLGDEPMLKDCLPSFQELCEIGAGCSVKAEASALYMHRSAPGSREVLLNAAGGDAFDATYLQFPFEVGPRVSLTVLDCEGWGCELNYFGIDGWSASGDVPTGGTLIVDNVTANQVSLTDAHFDSIARFYSSEFNFRRPLFGDLSLLAGFRWLDMTDQYMATGTDTSANTVSETIVTHNHMFGSQIGVDGTLPQIADCWRIRGFVKVGTLLNFARQTTALSDPDPPGSNIASGTNTRAAYFGEAGLVAYYQITKHLSASGGYQVMFVGNVAQPVNQLAVTNLTTSSASVDTSSGLFYHGATAGLELTW